MKKRIIPFLISLILIAGLIYFSDIGKMMEIISKTNLFYISLAVLIVVSNLFIRTARWKYLLKKVSSDIGFFKTIPVFAAGMFLSNLTPGKVGDPIRSLLFKKVAKKRIGITLPSIFLERMFDIFTMVMISLFGLIFVISVSDISIYFFMAMLFYTGLFSVGIFILISKKRTEIFFNKIREIFSFIPKIKNLKTKMSGFSKNLSKSFLIYNNTKTVFITFLITIGIWILEGISFSLIFKSIGLDIPIIYTIVIVPLVTLVSVLTFLPGGLGSAEIMHVLIFTSIFGITASEVTVAILLSRFLFYLLYASVGSMFIFNFKK